MLKRIMLLLAVLFLGVGVRQGRTQDDDHYKQQVMSYLSDTDAYKEVLGYNFKPLDDGTKIGYIKNGGYQDEVFRFRKGYAYALIGRCDEDCRRLSFELYDQEGNRVSYTEGNGNVPVIWLLAMQSGDYRVRATMPGCSGFFGCYWGVEVVSK
ncbi:MAG TPA: hypothetical protein VGG42_10580 [Acidobacteriaceae bacterium]|jgi:hypothetical protein